MQHPTNAAKHSDWGWGWGWTPFEQLIMARRSSQQVSQALEQWVKTGLDCNNKDTLFKLGYLLQAGISYCDLNNTFSLLTEKAYLKALELNPNDTPAWNNLGNLYADHLQQYDQAEHAYLKALELDNQDYWPYFNLAQFYAQQNKIEQAAMTNNSYFFRLKEQCWECQKIGRGMPLAKLMMQNPHAEFLRPFELALREVNGDDESKKAAPAEVQQMVDEIVTAMKLRLS